METLTTWTKQRVFDPKTIKKSTTITLNERLRLLFVKNQYAIEDNTMIRYKKLRGVAYVLDVKHGQKTTDKPNTDNNK